METETQDWFAQNHPAQASGDWFADNHPNAQPKTGPFASWTPEQWETRQKNLAKPAPPEPSNMPSWSDLGHAVGIPTSQAEAQQMGEAEAKKGLGTVVKEAIAKTPGVAVISVPVSMAKEGYRAIRHPLDPMAGVHAGAAMNPFAAPVIDAMTEQGLGSKEANATGIVNAVQLGAGLGIPKIAPIFKAKPPLARALGVPSETATTATPFIQNAAREMGIDLPKMTADDVIAATKHAKTNVLRAAQAQLPEGQTLADLPPEQVNDLTHKLSKLSEVEKAITDAQTKAAAAKPGAPATRGAAAVQALKGGGKVAVADVIGRALPGGRLAADVVGLTKGTPDIIQGIRGMVRPQLTAEMLDSRLQNALTSNVPHTGEISIPEVQPEQTRPPYQPLQGDLRVQPSGEQLGPPALAGGDLQPIMERPEATITSERGAYMPLPPGARLVESAGERLGPPSRAGGDLEPVSGNPRFETQPPAKPGNSNAVIQPYEKLTLHGAQDGETAALMQLTHTGGQGLRQIASSRGLKIPLSADNNAVIRAIHDDLSPEEIQQFAEAARTQNAARASSVANVDPAIVADNKSIAQKLYDEADAMQKRGEGPYRVRAWRAAAESIEARPTAVRDLIGDTEALKNIKGVSSAMADHIQEALQGKQFTHVGDTPAPMSAEHIQQHGDALSQARAEWQAANPGKEVPAYSSQIMQRAAEIQNPAGGKPPSPISPLMKELQKSSGPKILGDASNFIPDELKNDFADVAKVQVNVNPSLEKLGTAYIKKLTPAQIEAGVPLAHIELHPLASDEVFYHELAHVQRAMKGRPMEGQGVNVEPSAAKAGRYFAKKAGGETEEDLLPLLEKSIEQVQAKKGDMFSKAEDAFYQSKARQILGKDATQSAITEKASALKKAAKRRPQ